MKKQYAIQCAGLIDGTEDKYVRVRAHGYYTKETRVAHITEVIFYTHLGKPTETPAQEFVRMMLVAPWGIYETLPSEEEIEKHEGVKRPAVVG